MAWIEVCRFSYTYPGTEMPVIRDLNWSVEKNEFVAITGKTGSGKSTLGKALAGFLFQDEEPQYTGEIRVNGTDMSKIPLYEASERVAYVQQNPEDQFCTLSVIDEIAFGLENRCYPAQEIETRIDQALTNVSGQDLKFRTLSTLSGGEKQKVAIASMLALSPDVLILDEPTSNLDPLATKEIFETLNILREKLELTVIIIEHKLHQLRTLEPKFYCFDEGRLHTTQDVKTPPIVDKIASGPGQPEQPRYPETTQPLIKLSQVNVSRGNNQVLHHFYLEVFPGEFIAIMGPNGSGKSTLLLTLMGLIPPQTGGCEMFNQNLSEFKISSLAREIGFVFQNPDHQIFTQSVWDEATLMLKNFKSLSKLKESQTRKVLNQFELSEKIHQHPQRLSYGEKRRLNLAAVLLHNPKILLIDELLIGQDKASADNWMSFLRSYADQGNSVILVNHHADMTEKYCSRIIFLEAGQKIIDAPILDAFTDLTTRGYTAFLPTYLEESICA